jgi:hypothetical protein
MKMRQIIGEKTMAVLEVQFKKDMNNIELMGIEHIINTIGEEETITPLAGLTAEDLGMAYTSSGEHACYNVCNGDFAIDYRDSDLPIVLSYFTMTNSGMLVAVAHDCFDNTYYYEIEPSDF